MSLFEPVVSWWHTRESREQKLLLIGGVFAAAAVLYSGFSPVVLKYSASVEALRTADADHRWLKEQVLLLSEIRTKAGGVLPVHLPAEEIKAKIEGDLQKKEMQGVVVIEGVGGVNTIKVTVEGGRGGDVMRWIEELAGGGYSVASFELRNRNGRLTGVVVIEV